MSRPLSHRDLECRARRALLWCAGVLCISPIAGGWLVDHCPLHIRFPLAASKLSAWKSASPAPNVLFLGSSRMESFVRGGDAAEITDKVLGKDCVHSFDATIMGGEPVTMEFLTRLLLASRSTAPRLVVLETDSDLLARDNLYFKLIITRQLTAASLPQYAGDIIFCHDAISRLLSSRLIPFYLHRSHLIAWTEAALSQMFAQNERGTDGVSASVLKQLAPDYNGKILPPPDVRLRLALSRFQAHLRHYQISGATSSAFERTVAMLRQRGCTVVLVQTPLSSAQRALFGVAMRSQFDDFIQQLCHTYGCDFFDYSDKLPDTLFSDNHHGNSEGSLQFTDLLAHEVVAPAWRNLERKKGE